MKKLMCAFFVSETLSPTLLLIVGLMGVSRPQHDWTDTGCVVAGLLLVGVTVYRNWTREIV